MMALLHKYHLFNFHRDYRDPIVFIIVNKSQRPEDDLGISSLLTQKSKVYNEKFTRMGREYVKRVVKKEKYINY